MGKYDDQVFWHVDGTSWRGLSTTKNEVIIFFHTKSITYLFIIYMYFQFHLTLAIIMFLTFFIDFTEERNKNTKNLKINHTVIWQQVKSSVLQSKCRLLWRHNQSSAYVVLWRQLVDRTSLRATWCDIACKLLKEKEEMKLKVPVYDKQWYCSQCTWTTDFLTDIDHVDGHLW
jgi:hypothetical protein